MATKSSKEKKISTSVWQLLYQTETLIVPVIKNADQLSLSGLAKAINDLAYRARNKNFVQKILKVQLTPFQT